MSPRAFRLMLVHRRIDEEIRVQQKRVWPDVLRIQRLKKIKLAVKDTLHRLSLGRRAHRVA